MLQGISGNATPTDLGGLLENVQIRDKPIVVDVPKTKGKPEMWQTNHHRRWVEFYVVGVVILVASLAWPLIGQDVTTIYMATVALISIPQTTNSLTSGCGVSSPWKFDSTYHSNRTLGDRSFYVHIPESYNSNVPHAVVLSFHGNEKNDTQQERISGFSQQGLIINNRGIIAVYPLGAWGPERPGDLPGHAWQGAPYAKPGVDDIAFTKGIIGELKANLCVDEKRIYAAGKSNGGGFTNLLACTSSTASLIAAFAAVSPALYPGTLPLEGCDPGRVVPIIAFHGLADHTIPFHGQDCDKHGNTDYALPAIPVYREAWAKRDGCTESDEPSVSHPHKSTTAKSWQCSSGDSRAVVKGYTVKGLGHSWPNTNRAAPFNATTDDIVPFFEAHPFH